MYGVDAIGMSPEGYPSDHEATNVDAGYDGCRPATNPTPTFGDGVVTPHASFLALPYAPREAVDNLRNIETTLGAYGDGGFYDSVAVRSNTQAKRYLSLDQGMVLGAVGNLLGDDVLHRSFGTPRRGAGAATAHRPGGVQRGGDQVTGARTDWEARIGRRSDTVAAGQIPVLAPPSGVYAAPGVGQVTLHWDPVDGAVGYQVVRDGVPLDHHGGDVLAVPHGPYADTTGEPGVVYRYAVATVTDVDVTGPEGDEVLAASLPSGDGDRRGPGGPGHGGPRAPPPVAADDRLGAPQPPAERRDGGRPEHRGRPHERAARGARRARASRPSGRTRSCATTSASTARSTASRCTTSRASTPRTTPCWRSGCGPSSSCRTCRATWPRTRT